MIEEMRYRDQRVKNAIEVMRKWPEAPDYRELKISKELEKAKARTDRIMDVLLDENHGSPDWKPPLGLTMIGSPGIGKTYLMKALYREMLRHHKTAIWWRAHELVRKIQSAYGDLSKQGERGIQIEKCCRHDTVFIDDLGKERGSEDVETIMWELFDALYDRGCILICSSNFTMKQWNDAYDDAVKDRIRGMSTIVEVEGDSKRRTSGRYIV